MPIESLHKITYENLEQFLELINSNFAIVENSPLYKGIPGNEVEGEPGLRGIRGIKFLFVNYSVFAEQFPGELSLPSQINLNFINSKLETFENKVKILLCLGVEELVDKDVIVLTNSNMLSYNFIDGVVNETGQSFNPETNLLSNINTIIEDYVTFYINNNPILNSLSNVLVPFKTYAKNYADNNSTFITSELTESSIFSPYIPGFNNQIGIAIDNHQHFGYSDLEFPIENKGTFVFGNMKRYYQLLMNTISTAGTETLSSDYAPGNNNIPAAVILQDTYRNGIYLGHKDKTNLKRFASIYKNEANDLVLKSDSSMNESEFSELLINRAYMRFKKLVQFFDSLEVSRDLSVFADINNKFLKTGKFTNGASVDNDYNTKKSEHGAPGPNTIKLNVSEFEEYIHYVNNVLITDENGRVSKDYTLENVVLSETDIIDLNQIENIPSSQYHVLTSNYFRFLCDKINSMSNYISGNYWRKDQYDTEEIPALRTGELHASASLTVGSSLFNVFQMFNSVNIGANTFDVDSQNVKFSHFANKVMVMKPDGYVSTLYSILTTDVSLVPNVVTGQITLPELGAPDPENKILTAKYWNYLRTAFNYNNEFTATNYWRKNQYNTFDIPELALNKSLYVDFSNNNEPGGYVHFSDENGSHFHARRINSNTNTQVTIGNGNTLAANPTQLVLDTPHITYTKFTDKIIVTDSTGRVLNKYSIFNGNIYLTFTPLVNSGIPYTLPVLTTDFSLTPLEQESRVPTYSTIYKLINIFNSYFGWINLNFWRKDQYNTAEIPAIHVAGTLKANGNVKFGNQLDPNIETIGNDTVVGKSTANTKVKGVLNFSNYGNKVIVTNATGEVVQLHELETAAPNSGPGTGGMADADIVADYWNKNLQPQVFQDYPIQNTRVVTSNYIGWIVSHLKAIRTLIFDRPTYAEMNELIVQKGTIVYWNNVFGPIPAGYVICDGGIIPGTTLYTPNLINKYVKGSLIPNTNGGNTGHLVGLTMTNIPAHVHTSPPHRHRMFTNATILNEGALALNPNGYVRHAGYNIQKPSGGYFSNNYDYVMGAEVTGSTPSLGWTGFNDASNTGSAGLATPNKFNIEPQNMTLIPIMKY